MLIGYARASTLEQNLAPQRDALTVAGCRRIFTDEGATQGIVEQPGLHRALAALTIGDTLVVCSLDRVGRNLAHLIRMIADFGERGVGFRSLSDPIDTMGPGGRLVLHIMGALADFERRLRLDRTRAGIWAAKKGGVHLGRPCSLTPAQVEHARILIARGGSARAVAVSLGVGKSTLYRHLQSKPSVSTEQPYAE